MIRLGARSRSRKSRFGCVSTLVKQIEGQKRWSFACSLLDDALMAQAEFRRNHKVLSTDEPKNVHTTSERNSPMVLT